MTGFQLMNYTNPTVSRTIQDWLEFDSKDLKSPKRRLKVKQGLSHKNMILNALMMDLKRCEKTLNFHFDPAWLMHLRGELNLT